MREALDASAMLGTPTTSACKRLRACPSSSVCVAAIVLLSVCMPHAARAADGPVLLAPGAQAAKPGEVSRIGTVALVREIKERGLTSGNWTGVVGSLFTFDSEKDVVRLLYEVTVFFADGSQGEITLDRDPGLRAGQRVRVTGTRIEALER